MNSFKIKSHLYTYEYSSQKSIEEVLERLRKESDIDLICIDQKVFDLHEKIQYLSNYKLFLIDVNSKTKSILNLEYILTSFSNFQLKKISKVVVIGGATLQDIIATACCLYYRGIKWIFIPTTVLAQGDSCVGSKTSLDGVSTKNQYGVFYPPNLILNCSEFLFTLPLLEIYSGLGDVLHYLLPYEVGNNAIKDIKNAISNKNLLINICQKLSDKAMQIKAKMVEIDEFDIAERAIFNYGHTFGHALEKSCSKYIPHGLAVLLGIHIALSIAIKKSSLSKLNNQKTELEDLLNLINIKGDGDSYTFSNQSIIKNLLKDKKNDTGNLVKCILPTELENSLWTSINHKPQYGLNKFNMETSEALTYIKKLSNINKIDFI